MIEILPNKPSLAEDRRRKIRADYDRFARQGLPADMEMYLLERYGIDVSTHYAGLPIPNPWGKASGQLSMTARQVAEDVKAGLGFVVLKTVIAQDEQGSRSMEAWAPKESRMVVEPIVGQSGRTGWTVSWKGRGWWHSFQEYLELVGEARRIARDTQTLIVPSCKYHLPTAEETTWKLEEYEYTTRCLLEAWRATAPIEESPMPLEKDFSPTLAGSQRAQARQQIIAWLRTVPALIHRSAGSPVRIGLKLFNALFDDDFQLEMLQAIHRPGTGRPDYFIYGNRLFDPDRQFDDHRGIAYGGPDLSDRNLRVMRQFRHELETGGISSPPLSWSATGNITTGKMALEYALLGASSFQLHTFFQLPAAQFAMKEGSRTEKALLELYFHPETGLIAWLQHLAGVLSLPRNPLRLRDVIGGRFVLDESAS